MYTSSCRQQPIGSIFHILFGFYHVHCNQMLSYCDTYVYLYYILLQSNLHHMYIYHLTDYILHVHYMLYRNILFSYHIFFQYTHYHTYTCLRHRCLYFFHMCHGSHTLHSDMGYYIYYYYIN